MKTIIGGVLRRIIRFRCRFRFLLSSCILFSHSYKSIVVSSFEIFVRFGCLCTLTFLTSLRYLLVKATVYYFALSCWNRNQRVILRLQVLHLYYYKDIIHLTTFSLSLAAYRIHFHTGIQSTESQKSSARQAHILNNHNNEPETNNYKK